MTGPPRLIALRPLRHECHLCGTCCQGWHVHLVSDEEKERVLRQAAELGIADPVNDKTLRTSKGRCVFLSDENRCRIHETYGSDEKPVVCRQYPRRATMTEDGLRVGVDPTCSSNDRSWRDGPEIQPLVGMQSELRLDHALAASERALIGILLAPDMTVARFVATITDSPSLGDELPVGFVGRIIAALRIANLPPMLEDPDWGPDLLWRVGPLAEFLRGLDPANPPSWASALSPERDAFALEMLRRHLFLRIGDPMLPPIAQTLLVVTGILVCAWSDPMGDFFGGTLAAWMRVIRIRSVWARMMPETETARWLLSGDGAPPAPDGSGDAGELLVDG